MVDDLAESVGIIGAGQLGSRLGEQLISDDVVEQVFLANRSISRLEGIVQSLETWSCLRTGRSRFGILDWNQVEAVPIIVLAIKDDYDPRTILHSEPLPNGYPRNLRYVGLVRDYRLIKSVCSKLKEYCGVVLVATNPVDVVTTVVSKLLPSATVLGLGPSVDEARIRVLLAREYGGAPCQYEAPIVGEHGGEQYPVFERWILTSSISEKRAKKITDQAQAIGVNIFNNLGYTTHDCAVAFSEDVEFIASKRAEGYRLLSTMGNGASIGRIVNYGDSRGFYADSDYRDDLESKLKKIEIEIARISEILDATTDQ